MCSSFICVTTAVCQCPRASMEMSWLTVMSFMTVNANRNLLLSQKIVMLFWNRVLIFLFRVFSLLIFLLWLRGLFRCKKCFHFTFNDSGLCTLIDRYYHAWTYLKACSECWQNVWYYLLKFSLFVLKIVYQAPQRTCLVSQSYMWIYQSKPLKDTEHPIWLILRLHCHASARDFCF